MLGGKYLYLYSSCKEGFDWLARCDVATISVYDSSTHFRVNKQLYESVQALRTSY